MKFLFSIVITIFCITKAVAQCPSNENTSVEIKQSGTKQEVHIKFKNDIKNIKEFRVIKFGIGVIENAVIDKKRNNELIIKELNSGEYMIQIIGQDCTSIVGTDKDYKGFIIK